jgi:chromosome partitioning protein
MGKVVTVANHKGGVGKTSTTYNLADALARMGLKVLCMDMDPQSNLSTSILKNGQHPSGLKCTSTELLLGTCTIDETIVNETSIPNVSLISSSIRMASLEEKLRLQDFSPATKLREKMEIISKFYDVCLIDTPPALSLLTANALAASDYFIMPLEAGSKYGLDGASDFIDLVKRIRSVNPGIRMAGALLTRYDGRKTVCIEVERYVRAEFERVFTTTISAATAVQQSEMLKQTVLQVDRRSKPAREYAALAAELAELMKLKVSEENVLEDAA